MMMEGVNTQITRMVQGTIEPSSKENLVNSNKGKLILDALQGLRREEDEAFFKK